MEENRPSALQLAARLGSALDALEEPSEGLALATVELRQVAGLTAGSSVPLLPGTHEFGPANAGGDRLEPGDVGRVAFRLTVEASGEVTVEPGDADVRVDGDDLTGPRPLGRSIIDVGSAALVVRPVRVQVAGAVPAPALEVGPVAARISVPLRPPAPPAGARHFRARRRHDEEVAAIARHLDQDLSRTAAQLAASRRAAHPDPEELVHRARYGDDLAGGGPRPIAAGLVPVALGTVPWEPPVDIAGPIEPALRAVLQERSSLPLVPILADLGAGPLAVVAGRAAGLAVARYLVTALAVTTPPGQLRLRLDAEPSPRWRWAEPLVAGAGRPHDPIDLVVVEAAGRGRAPAAVPGLGRIGPVVLVQDEADVPADTATAIVVHRNGTATVVSRRDHRTASGVIPLGLPSSSAAPALSALADRHHRFLAANPPVPRSKPRPLA